MGSKDYLVKAAELEKQIKAGKLKGAKAKAAKKYIYSLQWKSRKVAAIELANKPASKAKSKKVSKEVTTQVAESKSMMETLLESVFKNLDIKSIENKIAENMTKALLEKFK